MASFFDEIAKNNLKSIILMLLFLGLFSLIIYLLVTLLGGGLLGVAVGIFIVLIYAVIVFAFGNKFVLAVAKAKEADRTQYKVLYSTVESLALAAQVPMPKVYIMDDPNPNAFATGRDRKHSYVCVTSGLLSTMNDRELQGVLAHEMSHIYDNDIRFMMIAVVFAGAIGLIAAVVRSMLFFGFMPRGRSGGASGLLLIIGVVVGLLAPFFALLIRLAISRRREYMADANGARMIRDPAALANALIKIKNFSAKPAAPPVKSANEITASLYFSNPLTKNNIMNIFSTHPPIDERIARLQKMY